MDGCKTLLHSLFGSVSRASKIWEFPKIGGTLLFWGPYNKDPTI